MATSSLASWPAMGKEEAKDPAGKPQKGTVLASRYRKQLGCSVLGFLLND